MLEATADSIAHLIELELAPMVSLASHPTSEYWRCGLEL